MLNRLTPLQNGYTFSGWYLSSSGGTKVSFPFNASTDITIYARFTYIGTTITQSGSVNVTIAYNTTQRPGAGMYVLHIGYIPGVTVTFNKAFISIPSVSISIPNPNNSIYRVLPSTVNCQSITQTGFTTARSNDNTVQIYHPNSDYGCSGHTPIINWSATGKA